jgi:hypothetical protein
VLRFACLLVALAAAFFAFGPHLLLRGPVPPRVLVRAPHGACACAADAAPPLPGDGPRAAYSALVMDTRATPALVFAIRHMSCTLPADWPITLVAAPDMREFVATNFSDLLATGRLRAWELSPDAQELRAMCRSAAPGGGWCVAAETAPARAIPRARAFMRWVYDWDLSNTVPLSGALFAVLPSRQHLVFQTDGLLCRPFSREYLAELSAFDYVGPPWARHPGARSPALHAEGVGGNGGFSFRSTDVLARTLEKEYASRWFDEPLSSVGKGAEDVFFSERVEGVGGHLPPRDFASAFAVESVPHAAPWGYHKPWWYMGEDALRALFVQCPVIPESLSWSRPLSAAWDPASITSCAARAAAE